MSGAGGEFGGALDATLELERQVLEAEGVEGLVLRYGFFYGPGTSYARDGHQASEVRRRRFPIVGDGDGVFSFVHVEDAAAATVAACERGASGIYNVCDDEPAPRARVAPGLRRGDRREAAAARAEADRAADRRDATRSPSPTTLARRLEREGQARARLGARAIRAGARALPRRSDKF